MDKTQSAYYALLRAGLWNDPQWLKDEAITSFNPNDIETWGAIARIAGRTGTVGLVADGVSMLDPECQPQKLLKRLFILKVKLIGAHDKANRALHDTFVMIHEMGYQPVLLKGQALSTYYANPESRACGDIDIYIGEEHIDELVKKLTERGITCEEELNDTEKHIIFYHDDMVYELHRYAAKMLVGDKDFQQWWRQGVEAPQQMYVDESGKLIWEEDNTDDTKTPSSVPVRVARLEQNMVFTFYHVFHHLLGRYRTFKQFCDLACMLYACHTRIDKDELLERLDRYDLGKPWRIVGCYLHQYLGLPTDCIPGYDGKYMSRADRLARMLATSIFYDKADKDDVHSGRVVGKLRSYRRNMRAAMQSLPVFPRLTLLSLWQDTTLGVRLLFSPANRMGTQRHYQERKKQSNQPF